MSGWIGKAGSKLSSQLYWAHIVLAHLIDFLNSWCHVSPQWSNIHPANLIRLIYSRYKHVCANAANTIGVVNVHSLNTQSRSNGKEVVSYWPKFAALCLRDNSFYKAVATGNGINEFYREITRSNWKPSIAAMKDRSWFTVSFLTPLFFRYCLYLDFLTTSFLYLVVTLALFKKS
jgi:hypothetical protein